MGLNPDRVFGDYFKPDRARVGTAAGPVGRLV